MNTNNPMEQQFGIDIFSWNDCDVIGDGEFSFYNVEFVFESMKQYNGCCVDKTFDGKLTIFDKETGSRMVWEGYIIEIPEYCIALKNKFNL